MDFSVNIFVHHFRPTKQHKKLKILSKNNPQEANEEQKMMLKSDDLNLTTDERIALEVYGALKSKKTKKAAALQDDDSEEEPDDVPMNTVQDLHTEEAEERRAITYQMSKNKGLTPKRSKLARNPRVKHRVKFAKAKVRRKGQVREVRKEIKKYGGELSGINARVKKGTKLS
jgi:U3 small nucleolar RNA-associated protein 3